MDSKRLKQIALDDLLSGGAAAVTYTISGTVYDADGSTAVAGATVALGALSAVSAANGIYIISDVPAGTSGSMTCTKTGYSWTAKTIAAMSGNLTGQNYSNAWWAAGGCAASCVRAYAAKGAASLAASYVNLANPGTGDAAPGVAPTFNASTGWTFDGATTYLTTGLTIADTNVSVFVAYTGAANNQGTLLGFTDAFDPAKSLLLIFPFSNDDTMDYENAGLKRVNVTDQFTSGVAGIAGKTAYWNGASQGAIGAGTYPATAEAYIGVANRIGVGPQSFFNKSIQAVAFYNTSVAAQAAVLSAAMAALP